MKLFLTFLCLLKARGEWGIGIRPEDEDEDLDCGLRTAALDFANDIVSFDTSVVADALQLDTLCGGGKKTLDAAVVRLGEEQPSSSCDCVVTVDPKTTESPCGPHGVCGTLSEAVEASRDCDGVKKAVLLVEGTHYLAETLTLDRRDRGLTISSKDDDRATISGGVPLNLDWTLSDDGIMTAAVDEKLAFSGTAWSLWADGRREIRARHPNGDPETMGMHTDPSGWFDGDEEDWNDPDKGESGKEVKKSHVRDTPYFHDFKVYTGVPRYDPPYSFWGATPRPTKLDLSNLGVPAVPGETVVHAFHGDGWGGWQFEVVDFDDDNNVATLQGGQQEARGNDKGGAYYVENSLAYLDADREFFFDHGSRLLSYKAPTNDTANFIVASNLANLLKISDGADDVALLNLRFTQTRPTFLEAYRVPSGGDWSIHADAAIVASNVTDFRIQDSVFTSIGGNAVLLQAGVNRTTIKRTDFHNIGASGVVLLGHTLYDDDPLVSSLAKWETEDLLASEEEDDDFPPLMDGVTKAHVPLNTTIEDCMFREIGIYEKQTSGVIQFLSARTTIRNSVFFNGPRAGINFNDGYHGGHSIDRCLMFNWVRETSDHGNVNSWDRQPYASKADPQDPLAQIPSTITNSFIFNNYHSEWPLDHDDGSAYFEDSDNVIIWGGVKNYKGFHKVSKDSLYVNVDLGKQGDRGCAMDDSDGAYDKYKGNTCIMKLGNKLVSSKVCDPKHLNDTMPLSSNNFYFFPDANPVIPCGDDVQWSLDDYQAIGMDSGSTVADLPSSETILAWVRTKLGLDDSFLFSTS